jgi:macrolide transport system ATP-binding/permease protein
MKELLRRLRWLFRRDEFERDLDEEMRHHLAMKAEQSGDREAARQFGNIALLKEDSRAVWGFRFWEHFAHDVRYGLRAMRTNKLFSAMAVLSLALGIGANTAIYSFTQAILLRALPVPHPGQLALFVWRTTNANRALRVNGTGFRYGNGGMQSPNFPFAFWEMLRRNPGLASSVFAYVPANELTVVARNHAAVSRGMYVSGNFYSGLGTAPALGRLIADDDDREAGPRLAVITWNAWRERFASDPRVIGETIHINTVPFTVIGVSAPGFFGVDNASDPEFFIPLHTRTIFGTRREQREQEQYLDHNFYWLEMMARLRPGVSIAQAQSVFGEEFRRFAESTAASEKEKTALPQLWLQNGATGRSTLRHVYSKPLYVLMTMAGLILLIACANIASLLLARATARRREIATRLSLGASRGRVILQLLTESVLLSVTGGVLGVGVAIWGIHLLSWLLSDGREGFLLRATLDWPVLCFAAGLAIVTGLVFGLTPAIQATAGNVAPALKEARIGVGHSHFRGGTGQVLVIAQIAISLLLAVGAGLFLRTLENLHSIPLGFNRENLLIFKVNANEAGYKDQALAQFYEGLADRFRAVPGVRSGGFAKFPLLAGFWNDEPMTIPSAPQRAGRRLSTCIVPVDASFLATMQIPVLVGRDLNARDIRDPRSAVISEVFAKKFFPAGDAIGRHFQIGAGEKDFEIVGIAKKTIYNSLKEDTPPVVYVPYTFDLNDLPAVWFELRSAGDPSKLAQRVREVVHEAAPSAPVTNLKTQAAQIDQTISQERTFANLCTCFAFLALIVTGVGLYGMTAYAVARRTSEIGIRMALGAERWRIVAMMLRQAVALAAVGLAIGLVAAWQTTHIVGSFLFRVKPEDPGAIAGATVLLLFAAIAAAWGPARRAARVDPMVALRNE